MKMKIKKMFDECAKKFGTVVWNGVELAITEDPYPDGQFNEWWFTALAMDKAGNLWEVCWDVKPDADECLDYASQVEEWDKPNVACMLEKGYYLDD